MSENKVVVENFVRFYTPKSGLDQTIVPIRPIPIYRRVTTYLTKNELKAMKEIDAKKKMDSSDVKRL